MKKQKITLYTILICISLNICAGKGDTKDTIKNDEYYLNTGGVGADTGSKVGLITVMYLTNTAITGWTSLKVTLIALATAVGRATEVGSLTIATAASFIPFLP